MEKTTEHQRITHDEIVINIIRYVGITDFERIDRMTIVEYSLLMEGMRLRHIDELENIHLLAYNIQIAKNTKEVGDKIVPVYPTFLDFFDKELHITGKSSKSVTQKADDDELDIYKLMSKA